MIKVGIGQDSHAILEDSRGKPLILGGVDFKKKYCLAGNSDSDVVLHALTNALSGITGKPILGPVADKLCQKGLKDSRIYLKKALEDLKKTGFTVCHVSISLECRKPKIISSIPRMRLSLANLLSVEKKDIGITATSGEGLSEFGRGKGIQAFCTVTARRLEKG